MCVITFPLFCDLECNQILYDKRRTLAASYGVNSVDKLEFGKLKYLLKEREIEVGDGRKVDVYGVRLDELIIGDPDDMDNGAIPLHNITAWIIDGHESKFIIGMNVLRHLTIQYVPAPCTSVCELTLSGYGGYLLSKDNSMAEMFHYK
jgi:hypothetical protein